EPMRGGGATRTIAFGALACRPGAHVSVGRCRLQRTEANVRMLTSAFPLVFPFPFFAHGLLAYRPASRVARAPHPAAGRRHGHDDPGPPAVGGRLSRRTLRRLRA